ncbi:SpdD-like protein [Streptomyces sp. HC44]|uniref:SpdD-like protein n=1 Tax=Streptomyces scabichelini TaxID=2711217 RepID=A0A6G4V8A0_9ACTN|nr:SpdD-like protein [Streptomyces scabichelini]NGO10201.1 SpdD-like protein [Streptomyces scabichelini]
MFRPKVPVNPMPTGIVTPPAAVEPTTVIPSALAQTPAPAPVAPTRPTVQLTLGALVAVVGGGTAVVLVVGAVLVSMLLAVAITATSVAVCAVVLRSLLNNQKGH